MTSLRDRTDIVWVVTRWDDEERVIEGCYHRASGAYAKAAELCAGEDEREAQKIKVDAYPVSDVA